MDEQENQWVRSTELEEIDFGWVQAILLVNPLHVGLHVEWEGVGDDLTKEDVDHLIEWLTKAREIIGRE